MEKSTILIVENENDVRNILIEIVAMLGFNYDVATDGIEAWNKIQNGHFSLVITDLGLPHMDGIELVGKMRNTGLKTPAILIAGIDIKCKKKDLCRYINCAYIDKPFTIDDLKTKINDLLINNNNLNNCPRSDCHK